MVTLAALLGLLGGCGDSDDETQPSMTEPETTSTTTTATTTTTTTTTTIATLGPGPTTTLVPGPTIAPVDPEGRLRGIQPTLIADGFERPADARSPVGDDRIFVVDQVGYVYVVKDGKRLERPFLDVSEEISYDENERGLVTIAFHPRFRENGRFYLFYTDLEFSARLVEYRVSDADPDRADPSSAHPIIAIPQIRSQHQSGSVVFGPDGYLWLSIGDGGGIGDPDDNGQDPSNLYGTIVRLDVDAADPYAIPPDNPFVGSDDEAAPEVWAYGLRNPWRIAIDSETGLLYIADVGQEGYEEVNAVAVDSGGGFNFGWSTVEGTECFFKEEGKKQAAAAGALRCDKDGITMPIHQHNRQGGRCATVGAGVYRGAAMPELHGVYFYGDYCRGALYSFRYENGEISADRNWINDIDRFGNITSIGTDGNGEMLVATLQGEIYRVDPVRVED